MKKVKLLFILGLSVVIVLSLAILPSCQTATSATTAAAAETTTAAAAAETTAAAAAETTTAAAETTTAAAVGIPLYPPANGQKYKFTVVVHSLNVSFWNPVKKGAEDAAAQVGADVNFTGVTDINHPEQVGILESLIATGSDGFATTETDQTAYNDVVKKAIDKGIPVIAINTAADPNPAMSYVGQDSFTAGQAMGNAIYKLIGDNGKIALTAETLGHAALETRMNGVKDVLVKKGYRIDILGTTTDLPTQVDKIMDLYKSKPDLQGWFGTSASDTGAGGIAIDKLGLKGKVFSGGFDCTSQTLDNLKAGLSQFTVDQNAYLQGYYTIIELYLYKAYGLPPSNIDTGIGIVAQDKADEFISLQKEGLR